MESVGTIHAPCAQTSTFTARLIRLAAQISPSAHKGSNNFWTGGYTETKPESSCRLWSLRNTVNQFASKRYAQQLTIRYVAGPRNQPHLIFATTSEPSPYSSDHGEILAIIAMDVHGSAGPRRRFVWASSVSASPKIGCLTVEVADHDSKFPRARTAHARGFGFQFFDVRIRRAPHSFIVLTWGS